eukprot:TRINITY_DN13465_c0_g1_i3.p1 TRINITY_DN13465_c0_g1~~TRINITY_DN13465_c0_g1_i3.p1  ORF type:complete len:819 (-),score=139.86 TRINITY_DN13465_c0_g1_i3:332-2788(-)
MKQMDVQDATRVVYMRIQNLEVENASKVLGWMLLQDQAEQDIVKLALASDLVLQSSIAKARKELEMSGKPVLSRQPSSAFSVFSDSSRQTENAPKSTAADNSTTSESQHSNESGGDAQISLRSSSLRNQGLEVSPDAVQALAWKPCLYFSRGYCKHGNNCRFLHSSLKDGSNVSSPGSTHSSSPDTGGFDDGAASSPGPSLEKLEGELQELLRGRRNPVSIASLPQLYYERFGKTLQAEGYMTESQRQGRAGYSLTKLLARLKGTVALVERPNGQRAVTLRDPLPTSTNEDVHRTAVSRERDDLSPANPSSRQIYLTFPAESTFSEEDVSAHFRSYGPVQDVRIPFQPKRMFGFVTFLYPSTVKTILLEGNPHYICGSRVLVKPYREKGKHGERQKNQERSGHSRYQQQSRSSESGGSVDEDPFVHPIVEDEIRDMEPWQTSDHRVQVQMVEGADIQLPGGFQNQQYAPHQGPHIHSHQQQQHQHQQQMHISQLSHQMAMLRPMSGLGSMPPPTMQGMLHNHTHGDAHPHNNPQFHAGPCPLTTTPHGHTLNGSFAFSKPNASHNPVTHPAMKEPSGGYGTDLHHMQSNPSFGYILDVLDSSDQAEEQTKNIGIFSQNGGFLLKQQQHGGRTTSYVGSPFSHHQTVWLGTIPPPPLQPSSEDGLVNGHNLPDSPFTSPLASQPKPELTFAQFLDAPSGHQHAENNTLSKPRFWNSQVNEGGLTNAPGGEMTCHLCQDTCADIITLECGHKFCIQCNSQVVRAHNRGECLICRSIIGGSTTSVNINTGSKTGRAEVNWQASTAGSATQNITSHGALGMW